MENKNTVVWYFVFITYRLKYEIIGIDNKDYKWIN